MNNNIKKRSYSIFWSLGVIFSLLLACITAADVEMSDSVSVFAGEQLKAPAYATIDEKEICSLQGLSKNSARISVLGVGFKDISVDRFDDIRLIPGGDAIGFKLNTDGVIVVGIGNTDDGKSPCGNIGLKVGDVITSFNGTPVRSAAELDKALTEFSGQNAEIIYNGSNGEKKSLVTPYKNKDGEYKLGIWVRDTMAGIGTLTYIEPENGVFGSLGHGICDPETGRLIPCRDGESFGVAINGATKGAEGKPGELRGFFLPKKTGEICKNTECGVFGRYNDIPSDRRSLPIGLKKDVKCADAEIICTTEDGIRVTYQIEIQKVISGNAPTKNMLIRIKDEKLLAQTGGIVQGMSGSPIIQNGRIIGAVTHVMINDPTRGYGIFIENMLKAST